jgi:hypothetical protein
MEELQPQDIEELLQELEEEDLAEESQPLNVSDLLRDLQAESIDTRKAAAERLGKVDESSLKVVRALVVVKETDSIYAVRKAAEEALRASVHQEYLQRLRDRMEETERDLFRVKRGDYQRVATSDSKILQGFLNFILGGPTRFD